MSLHYQLGSSVKNNSGAVLSPNISSTLLTDMAPNAGSNLAYTSGPKNDNSSDKAVIGVVFAKNNDRLLAMRSKDTVSGQTVLLNASGYPQYTKSIKYIESRVTSQVATAIRSGKFNIYSGQFNAGFPVNSTDAFGNDNAARVTRAAPGTLVFVVGKNATTHNYTPKN